MGAEGEAKVESTGVYAAQLRRKRVFSFLRYRRFCSPWRRGGGGGGGEVVEIDEEEEEAEEGVQ